MSETTLHAPVRGWLAALDEVPDEVFSRRILGEGICIDPTGNELHAPCDGEVISLPASRHAVALRTSDGAEILLHIGIDTVELNGAGFEAHVAVGDHVRRGQRLITFDLQRLAGAARSLMTPIVLTNADQFDLRDLRIDREIEVGEELCRLVRRQGAVATVRASSGAQHAQRVTIGVEHGIHARPAATLAQVAKAFDADVQVRANGRAVNAKSAVALLSLGLKHGDQIELLATGESAAQALSAMLPLLSGTPGSVAVADVHTPAIQRPASEAANGRVRAVIASRGLAVGYAVVLHARELPVEEAGRGAAYEGGEFERARGEVRARLERMALVAPVTTKEVIAAHLEFLDDWELVAAARRAIAQGKSAGFAWRRAVRDSADSLRALGDARLLERIDDLLDLEAQVIEALLGRSALDVPSLPERAIVICEDLKPSQFVALDATRVAGLCMAAGGPTSHVAILAGALGIPMLVAGGPAVLESEPGRAVILDAEDGFLHLMPDAAELASVDELLEVRQQRRQLDRASAQAECRTADDERIEVFANLGSLAEVTSALANGAEGCGLLRSEFLFLERSAAPDEEEQQREYQAIATALGGRPLIVRTLDVGGDKPIPYLPLPDEENPALGLRGIRTSLWRPDLLRTQLRAILRVKPFDQCRLLLPMITDVAELRAIRRIVGEVRRELQRDADIRIGVMIETPAAAMLADQLAQECDFVSIGTNDLTQYTLAMDRMHAELAHRIDGLHPSVLRVISAAASGARRHDRLIAVCGGLASDPAAVPILLGLGVRELSVVPAAIPHIKALVRGLTMDAAHALAQAALQLESAEGVRALVHQHAQQAERVSS